MRLPRRSPARRPYGFRPCSVGRPCAPVCHGGRHRTRARLAPVASFAQWVEGARPRTLPNAVAPVIAGTGAAAWLGAASWWKALLALVVAVGGGAAGRGVAGAVGGGRPRGPPGGGVAVAGCGGRGGAWDYVG